MQVLTYYDARGGTIECEVKQDKLGLQLIRRRKRRGHAQEGWIILTEMAHNLLVWTRDWMFAGSRFESDGMLRLVQAVLNMPGQMEFNGGRLQKVSLVRMHPFAAEMQACLAHLFRELS